MKERQPADMISGADADSFFSSSLIAGIEYQIPDILIIYGNQHFRDGLFAKLLQYVMDLGFYSRHFYTAYPADVSTGIVLLSGYYTYV